MLTGSERLRVELKLGLASKGAVRLDWLADWLVTKGTFTLLRESLHSRFDGNDSLTTRVVSAMFALVLKNQGNGNRQIKLDNLYALELLTIVPLAGEEQQTLCHKMGAELLSLNIERTPVQYYNFLLQVIARNIGEDFLALKIAPGLMDLFRLLLSDPKFALGALDCLFAVSRTEALRLMPAAFEVLDSPEEFERWLHGQLLEWRLEKDNDFLDKVFGTLNELPLSEHDQQMVDNYFSFVLPSRP